MALSKHFVSNVTTLSYLEPKVSAAEQEEARQAEVVDVVALFEHGGQGDVLGRHAPQLGGQPWGAGSNNRVCGVKRQGVQGLTTGCAGSNNRVYRV